MKVRGIPGARAAVAAAALAVVVAAPASDARAEDERIDLGVFLGGHLFSKNNEIGAFDVPDADSPENSLAGGARVGYMLREISSMELGVEAELAVMPTGARSGDADLTLFGFRLQGLLHFDVGPPELRPFALVGTGWMSMSSSDDMVLEDDTDFVGLHGGGGVKYQIDNRTGVRGDLRLLLPPSSENEAITADWEITVGLYRTFGGAEPAPDPEPEPEPDPDPDGDGIAGAADACPQRAEDMDGFQDTDGCPDNDNDGDGILDASDECPDQPESKNGIDDTDGCPEDDEDGDGLVGSKDKCPGQPEDMDGYQDADGCPEADNDSDGIVDTTDQCPDKPETANGYQDLDGCPDEVPEKVKKFTGVIKGIYFATGKANLRRRSNRVLNEAVEVLKEFPKIRVEIQGHTDSRGSDEINKTLSQARANIVRAYLVKKGIAPERLTAVGYGEDDPIAENDTDAGRAQNRRVEFKLIGPQVGSPGDDEDAEDEDAEDHEGTDDGADEDEKDEE